MSFVHLTKEDQRLSTPGFGNGRGGGQVLPFEAASGPTAGTGLGQGHIEVELTSPGAVFALRLDGWLRDIHLRLPLLAELARPSRQSSLGWLHTSSLSQSGQGSTGWRPAR